MSSNILNSIGLGNMDIAYLFIGMLALLLIFMIVVIVMIVKINKLNKRCTKFMRGKTAKSLEDDIIRLHEDNQKLKSGMDKNKKDINLIYHQLEGAFQKVGIVRYDAFQTMGGQLSYSLVLLDQNDNGFILNTIHSTEGCYSYTKDIENGKCELILGEEEQKALNMAMSTAGK